MNNKLAILSMFMLIALSAAYLLFLMYALAQMKSARADGLAKIDALIDQQAKKETGAGD